MAHEFARTRDLAEDDSTLIFDVSASNSTYLELTAGASGEPGRSSSNVVFERSAVAVTARADRVDDDLHP